MSARPVDTHPLLRRLAAVPPPAAVLRDEDLRSVSAGVEAAAPAASVRPAAAAAGARRGGVILSATLLAGKEVPRGTPVPPASVAVHPRAQLLASGEPSPHLVHGLVVLVEVDHGRRCYPRDVVSL